MASSGLAATLEGENNLSIIVKFSGSKSYIIDARHSDTVLDLKNGLAKEANMSPRNINLILAGQLLNDNVVLEDCDIGTHTTLHAFCWSDDGLVGGHVSAGGKGASNERAVPVTQLPSSGDDANTGENQRQSSTETQQETDLDGSNVDGLAYTTSRERGFEDLTSTGARPRLCSRLTSKSDYNRFFVFCKLCLCVRPAKLRLSCLECASGAFLVERGPSSWDDISSNTTIRGVCRSGTCSCRIPRFYLRCTGRHEGDVEGTAVVLKHIQANRRRVECIICTEIMSHVLIFPCPPGHVICLDCFRQYGSTCLSERRFVEHPQLGYTLPCPAGCADSHIEENHHFLLLGPEKYERYKSFGAEEYVLQNGGMLCPAPGCGTGLFPEGNDRLIQCQECRFDFCRECRHAYHPGPCEEYLESLCLDPSDVSVNDERAARACWESRSLSLIEETTKMCPGCQTKTERSGGCMHMNCSRCGKEWCWICIKPWSRDCQADHWFG